MRQDLRAANPGRFGRGAATAVAILLGTILSGTMAPLAAQDADEVTDPVPPVAGPIKFPDSQIEVADWKELDGWAEDDHEASFASFLLSCRALINSAKATTDDRPMRAALTEVCRRAVAAIPLDNAGAKKFFEENFRPVRIAKLGEKDGFLTGYYEPIVEGSRLPTQEYTVPLYRRPDDLIVGNKPLTGPNFPNKGVKIFRRVGKKKLVPYYERSEIDNGALDGRHLEICYLKDPVDAFFIHIQGSARVRLEDGTVLRVNYDGHNGHPYLPVGSVLIQRKIYTKDEMSMDRIREWMAANPDEGRAVRYMNKSYVFFRITELADHQEAEGAQGVPLTAGRSIAVDKALHVYGTPFFIEGDLPIADSRSQTKFRRLMLAQDTGSAIIGPARADIYWGAGEEAASVGGRIKHNARFTMLMPKDIDPVEAGAKFPLPPRQPGSPEPPPIVVAAAPPAPRRPAEAPTSVARIEPAARRPAASPPPKPAVVARAPVQANVAPPRVLSEVEQGIARTLELVRVTAPLSASEPARLARKLASNGKPNGGEDGRDDSPRRAARPAGTTATSGRVTASVPPGNIQLSIQPNIQRSTQRTATAGPRNTPAAAAARNRPAWGGAGP
jgi:peptidoglycan lytic transglycosylase A